MPTSETTNPKIQTLNELEWLKLSGFGKPPPRHGLNLLHWFATEYVYFTSESIMVPRYYPQNEEFGFHLFVNKPVHNGYRLLPEDYQPYYIVGNLNRPGADSLPDYFDDYYTGELDDSNTDRIIVSHNFDRIYVTEHINQWNFNSRATYRISKCLLNIISRMNRIYFLSEMGYDEEPTAPLNYNSSQWIVTNNFNPSTTQDYRFDMPEEQGQASEPLNYNSSQWIVTNNFNPSTTQDYRFDMPEEQGQASQKPPVEPPRSRGLWDYCTIL